MELVKKLEATIAGWYAQAPHMSKSGQQWLAKNIWWIALVGAIIGSISLVFVLFGVLFAGALLSSFGGVLGAAVAVPLILAAIISSAVAIVTVVVTFVAVPLLKEGQRRGWTLVFITILLQLVVQAVNLVLTFNLFDLIWGVLFAGIAAYFLFEVRSYFVAKPGRKPAADAPKKTA